MSEFDHTEHPHRRYNPLTEDWVVVVPYWASWRVLAMRAVDRETLRLLKIALCSCH